MGIALTKKEKQITELMLQGLNNDEICNKLIIGHATLRTHFTRLYKKLNIKRGKHTNDCRSLLILKLVNLKIKYADAKVKEMKEHYEKTLNSFIEIYQNKTACTNCPVTLMNIDCNKNKDICLEQIWESINEICLY